MRPSDRVEGPGLGERKGKRPKLVDEDHTPKQAEVVDLMARLRASLEGKGTGRGAEGIREEAVRI